jgi:type II secretion system protein N
MRRLQILRIVGYVAYSLAAFAVFLYFTFPAQVVGDRISHEVAAASGGAWSVSFEDMSLYRLTGLAGSGVRVRNRGQGGAELDVTLDELRLRVQILPLFLLRTSLSLNVVLGDGELDAQVQPEIKGGKMDLELRVRGLRLDSPPLLQALTGVAVGGELEGTLAGHWDGDPARSSGGAAITLRQAKVGPSTVSGFSIPAIDLGQLELSLDLGQGGRLGVASFKQQGGDVSAKISGHGTLRRRAMGSALDLCLQFKADEGFLNKNPKLRTALQLAEVRLRKDPKGYFHVPLSGTVSRPNLRGGLCRASPAARKD